MLTAILFDTVVLSFHGQVITGGNVHANHARIVPWFSSFKHNDTTWQIARGGCMFKIQVIDPSLPKMADGITPGCSIHSSDSLLGSRILAEKIAVDRGYKITDWRPFGGAAHIAYSDEIPVALIDKQ